MQKYGVSGSNCAPESLGSVRQDLDVSHAAESARKAVLT